MRSGRWCVRRPLLHLLRDPVKRKILQSLECTEISCVCLCVIASRDSCAVVLTFHGSRVPRSDPHIVLPLTDAKIQFSVRVFVSQSSRANLMLEIICTTISSSLQMKRQQSSSTHTSKTSQNWLHSWILRPSAAVLAVFVYLSVGITQYVCC